MGKEGQSLDGNRVSGRHIDTSQTLDRGRMCFFSPRIPSTIIVLLHYSKPQSESCFSGEAYFAFLGMQSALARVSLDAR